MTLKIAIIMTLFLIVILILLTLTACGASHKQQPSLPDDSDGPSNESEGGEIEQLQLVQLMPIVEN